MITASWDRPHDHPDADRLTIACSGCIDRVALDQDLDRIAAGLTPARAPLSVGHAQACVSAHLRNDEKLCQNTDGCTLRRAIELTLAEAFLFWLAWTDETPSDIYDRALMRAVKQFVRDMRLANRPALTTTTHGG